MLSVGKFSVFPPHATIYRLGVDYWALGGEANAGLRGEESRSLRSEKAMTDIEDVFKVQGKKFKTLVFFVHSVRLQFALTGVLHTNCIAGFDQSLQCS